MVIVFLVHMRNDLVHARYQQQRRGYRQARAFLTPLQTALVFMCTGLFIVGSLGYIVYTALHGPQRH